MVDPKPITLVSGENPNPDLTPQPFVVVGEIPAGDPAAHTHAIADVAGLQDILDDYEARITALEP